MRHANDPSALWGPSGRACVSVALAVLTTFVAGCTTAHESVPGERRISSLVWGGDRQLVANDAAELDEFGRAVSLSPAGDRALVGAYGESEYRGAAYVFVQNGDAWIQEQKLAAGDGGESDKFGISVSLDGNRALVGAYGASGSRGAAYVFVRNGSVWSEETRLVAGDGTAGDEFGWSVSLNGDRALVGAHGSDGARGAAYVFVRGADAWMEEAKLVAASGVTADTFGYAVSLAADRAAVGAPGRDGARGAAYVFARGDNTWAEEQKLGATDGAESDNFGSATSLVADRVLVGAYWKEELRGAAYMFVRAGNAWTEEKKLVAADGTDGDRFAGAVSLTADRSLVGALGRGVAYVFERNGSAWTEGQQLSAPGGDSAGLLFAWSVSLVGSRALVGASYTDQLRGAAHLFSLGRPDGDTCASAEECASAYCADGRCCDRGCTGACGACSVATGAVADGTCTILPAGTVPTPACGGLVCDGVNADCVACRLDSECSGEGRCTRDGTCRPKGDGPGCTRGDDCGSGHCEDEICCDRTCAPNERCRADLKVAGGDGICGPAKAAIAGAPCGFDVQCSSGHCANEVCEGNTPGDPVGVHSGCGCTANGAPTPRTGTMFWAALMVLLCARARRRDERSASRSWMAIGLALAGGDLSGCDRAGQMATVDGGRTKSADDSFLPARVRRMTNAEYSASVFSLLGVGAETEVSTTTFPRDMTQSIGFSVNDTQIVSSVLAVQLDSTARDVVAAARRNGQFDSLAPCGDPTTEGEECARTFISAFGARAYHRPLTADEVDTMLALYSAGAGDGGTYDDGIDLVARAILQAPGFIYLTELGQGATAESAGKATLTAFEIASELSYTAAAAPPDREILDDLDRLLSADARERHLRRLLSTREARIRLVRLVREWLGIDGVAELDKDSNVYPAFNASHSAMSAESVSFIDEVLSNRGGSLQDLLGAEWTVIDSSNGATDEEIASYYADYYGLGADEITEGRIPLAATPGGPRVGILNQGAFLSRFATAGGSNPVMRGVAVMRRVACLELPDPIALNINVVPPVPDPTTPRTTRDLYAMHSTDASCRSCHARIDALGFAFEQYDGMGAFRTGREEVVRTSAGTVRLPIDTTVAVAGTGTDLDGRYPDSNALARALAGSTTVRECMARQIFRGVMGHEDGRVQGAETRFLDQWRQLSVERQASLIETLVALVRSDVFIQRWTGP